jgi:hypothetical protein
MGATATWDRDVVKFNNGDYEGANNQEDDLAIITSKIPYRADEHADTIAAATAMTTNSSGAYAFGIIERTTDRDMFSFSTAPGPITVTATPYISRQYTIGNNLDIKIDLLSSTGAVLASANPTGATTASLNFMIVDPGSYYIRVSPSFDPVTPYSIYGSIGQYNLRTTRWYTIYRATMATNPKFIIAAGSMWAWGKPASTSADPKGSTVLGTVLKGNGLYREEPRTGFVSQNIQRQCCFDECCFYLTSVTWQDRRRSPRRGFPWCG